jgi:flagellar motor switch/type III secretory pathway protein FliN
MATAQVAPVQPETPPAREASNNPIEAYHWLQCKTSAEIPVPKFTVGDLLALRKGSVVQTATRVADDVPLRVNKILLGWGRFEVLGDRLALRITELA